MIVTAEAVTGVVVFVACIVVLLAIVPRVFIVIFVLVAVLFVAFHLLQTLDIGLRTVLLDVERFLLVDGGFVDVPSLFVVPIFAEQNLIREVVNLFGLPM